MTEGELKRFLSKIEVVDTGCWVWRAAKIPGHYAGQPPRYGAMKVGKRIELVHRLAYGHWVGPILPKMTIDHLCEVFSCVNPDHLEMVTRGENSRRYREKHPEWAKSWRSGVDAYWAKYRELAEDGR